MTKETLPYDHGSGSDTGSGDNAITSWFDLSFEMASDLAEQAAKMPDKSFGSSFGKQSRNQTLMLRSDVQRNYAKTLKVVPRYLGLQAKPAVRTRSPFLLHCMRHWFLDVTFSVCFPWSFAAPELQSAVFA